MLIHVVWGFGFCSYVSNFLTFRQHSPVTFLLALPFFPPPFRSLFAFRSAFLCYSLFLSSAPSAWGFFQSLLLRFSLLRDSSSGSGSASASFCFGFPSAFVLFVSVLWILFCAFASFLCFFAVPFRLVDWLLMKGFRFSLRLGYFALRWQHCFRVSFVSVACACHSLSPSLAPCSFCKSAGGVVGASVAFRSVCSLRSCGSQGVRCFYGILFSFMRLLWLPVFASLSRSVFGGLRLGAMVAST